MLQFLKYVLATIIGIGTFLILVFLGFTIFGAIFGGSSTPTVEKNSVLELDLNSVSLDYTGKYTDPWLSQFNEGNMGLSILVKSIAHAKKDENIKGIVLLNNTYSLGAAQSKVVRDALEDFKSSKKFIVSYADMYSQNQYYINSVADTIYLNPVGSIDFKGLATEVMYSKGFQDKIGVDMQVIRHGKYKSAVEGYLDNQMSAENREQLQFLLNDIWNNLVQDIAKSRKLTVEQLNQIATNLEARTPELALKNKLIDKIAYEDQFHAGIKKALKVEKKEDYKKISIQDYASANLSKLNDSKAKDYIAIIYAQGEIMPGEGSVTVVSEGAMRKSLQEAREDDDVKAIVLRVDSPGGSALTSELIWREIELTKKKKPVVVSMGNVAASGGYYIACNANKIVAEPNTITGSIGVFGVLPTFHPLATRWGLNAEQVVTHENAVDFSVFEPLSDKSREVITESIENVYDVFLDRVSKGRKMTREQVDAVAQGRIWTGTQAKERGLVDEIGNLQNAIEIAAKLAKVKSYKTTSYPIFENKFAFQDLLSQIGMKQTREEMIQKELGAEAYQMMLQLRKIKQYQGVHAVLPIQIKI
jgi:protease IV